MEVGARDVTVTAGAGALAGVASAHRERIRSHPQRWIARSPDAALDPRAEDLAMDLMQ